MQAAPIGRLLCTYRDNKHWCLGEPSPAADHAGCFGLKVDIPPRGGYPKVLEQSLRPWPRHTRLVN